MKINYDNKILRGMIMFDTRILILISFFYFSFSKSMDEPKRVLGQLVISKIKNDTNKNIEVFWRETSAKTHAIDTIKPGHTSFKKHLLTLHEDSSWIVLRDKEGIRAFTISITPYEGQINIQGSALPSKRYPWWQGSRLPGKRHIDLQVYLTNDDMDVDITETSGS